MPKWKELKRFCERDDWELYKVTDHYFYQKEMLDGTIKRTKVSKGSFQHFQKTAVHVLHSRPLSYTEMIPRCDRKKCHLQRCSDSITRRRVVVNIGICNKKTRILTKGWPVFCANRQSANTQNHMAIKTQQNACGKYKYFRYIVTKFLRLCHN